MSNFPNNFEKTVELNATAQSVFDFLDNHNNLVSHMDKPTLMMGGGSVKTNFDEKIGKETGSHIIMSGKAFGMSLYLDEVITVYNRPTHKEWSTVGEIKLIVIGHYSLGFRIHPVENTCHLTVFINYEMPKSISGKILGALFGKIYAKWCVNQMINSAVSHFKS